MTQALMSNRILSDGRTPVPIPSAFRDLGLHPGSLTTVYQPIFDISGPRLASSGARVSSN